MIRFFNDITASVFYTGFVRKGGGTVAAVITCAGLYFVNNDIAFFWITAMLFLIGTLTSEHAEQSWGHDSSRIVIDEAAGIAAALFMLEHSIAVYAAALILFRIFDIFKPFPVNKAQEITGGAGVMMDDIISGFMANIIIVGFLWLKNLLF